MSTRLQIIINDKELHSVKHASKQAHCSVSDWVRARIREGLERETPKSKETVLAAILKFAKYSGPTGDMDQILAEIERGRTEP